MMKPVMRKAGLGGWWCDIGFDNIDITRVTGCIETVVNCKAESACTGGADVVAASPLSGKPITTKCWHLRQ